MRHEFPDEYEPLNYCRGCGNDFTSVEYFDRHRIGNHEYDFSIDRPDGRRCMSEEEMIKAGLSKVRFGDSSRYDRRLAFGVFLWWDKNKAERMHRIHGGVGASDATGASTPTV